jgi:outer membrane protein
MNREHRWTLILALLAALAPAPSAAQAPPATAPPPAAAAGDTIRFTPTTPVESLLVSPITVEGERWTLARCIQTALQRNSDIRVAEARRHQASGSALSAWSGIIPSLGTEASYTYVIPDKTSSFRGAQIDTFFATGLATQEKIGAIRADVTSNILSGPAIGRKQQLDHLKKGSEHDEQEARNEVVYRVKQQYFNLLKAIRLAQVAQETDKLAHDEETRSEALLQVGTVARGDLLKARARRATTQVDRIRADNQVLVQSARLAQIVGVDPASRMVPDPVLNDQVVVPDSSDAIRQAVTTRPLMESARAVERAAHSGVFGARSQRLPVVSGSFGVQRTKLDEKIEDLVGVPNPPASLDTTRYTTEWQGNVKLSLPIFTGLQTEGDIRRAKGALLEAESQRRQRELDVAVEVQEAWLTLREAVQRIDVAREGLVSSEEDYKFSKGRYDLGAGTYLDLLTAEVDLANARERLIEAVADARIAEAGLEFAMGVKRY